nr:hypothetical protein Cry52Nrm1_p040 [Cryptomonas curvata]
MIFSIFKILNYIITKNFYNFSKKKPSFLEKLFKKNLTVEKNFTVLKVFSNVNVYIKKINEPMSSLKIQKKIFYKTLGIRCITLFLSNEWFFLKISKFFKFVDLDIESLCCDKKGITIGKLTDISDSIINPKYSIYFLCIEDFFQIVLYKNKNNLFYICEKTGFIKNK